MKDAWGIVKSQAWQNEHWETKKRPGKLLPTAAARVATHYELHF